MADGHPTGPAPRKTGPAPRDIWIAPARVFDGQEIRTGQALRLSDGRVTDLAPAPAGAKLLPGLVVPGFVDLQVNGGGGVMLNTSPTAEGIAAIIAAHRRFGTVAILPTVITDAAEVLAHAVAAAIAARDTPGMIGLHIEGPHISTARRGTHAAAHVRPMAPETLAHVVRLRRAGVRVMITLAPEAATPAQISELAALGAVVSLGHTDADAATMQAAIRAGARCGTHLFNAMSPMQGRAPGAVGAMINSDCFCGIICDGHHVADTMVGLAIRARPAADRMFLVSDAMATVGGPDSFDLYGQTITLRDGRLVNSEGSLAGAHVTQAEGLRRLVHHVGLPLAQALRMVTTVPATCIGAAALGRVTDRPARDLLILSEDLSVTGTLAQALEPGPAPHAAG